jgi:very-short-patch-repair endonuclease
MQQQLRLAIEAAERADLFDLHAMERVLVRSPGRRGCKPMKDVLAQMTGRAPWTRSELERRFLALIRAAGLPEPRANVLVAGELVDFAWLGGRPLIVELDGYRFHKSRSQFEKDRRRDAKLQAVGCRVVRLTQQRLEDEPDQVIRELLLLLGDAA